MTLYCGDCREILPGLSAESIITDPVWPKPSPLLTGSTDPWGLFRDLCNLVEPCCKRLVVQLGRSSDPRFLAPVPVSFPFLATCWLEYLPPSFMGRAVMCADVAYLFGQWPKTFPNGKTCLPGGKRANLTNSDYRRHLGANRSHKRYHEAQVKAEHPAMRRLGHVRWLCHWLGGASVIDPFAGSGTTAVACKALGIPCTLIEIEERFCELAVKRLSQGVLELEGDEAA